MGRIIDRIEEGMAVFLGAAIVFVAGTVSTEVILRQFFHYPLMWTVEISEYLQVYGTFLAAAWVLRVDGHARLESVTNLMNPSLRQYCFVITNLLGLLASALLAWFSAQVTWEAFLRATPVIKSLEFPKWLVLAPIPGGSLFLALEFARRLRKGRVKG